MLYASSEAREAGNIAAGYAHQNVVPAKKINLRNGYKSLEGCRENISFGWKEILVIPRHEYYNM